MDEGTFTFDGQPVATKPGQSIAAALTKADHRAFRATAKGGQRGMFCGMGVCQDCLVTVDGVPNKRACMTKAIPGLAVGTQVAFAALDASTVDRPRSPARTIAPDILVIGGGAGGLSAAISARKTGASVVVLDERHVPGGQYFKQAAGGRALDAQQRKGAALVQEARDSGAEMLGGVEVWGAFDGPLILAEHQGGALIARPKAIIVATGAYERPCMVPGWTLPGVMTTGAAQTLWRSYRTLPGKRVAICGSGPLNLQVAQELSEGGADVVMVAEQAAPPSRQPWVVVNMALAGPRLTAKGLGLVRSLHRAQVPVRYNTQLLGVVDASDGLHATFRTDAGPESTLIVDAICMNAGFEPQNEVLRLLAASMTYDPVFGHLRCERDGSMQTSATGVYAIGDCAGLGGAPAAMVEGRIAGRAAASALGYPVEPSGADQQELDRHRRFQHWLWRLYAPAPLAHSTTPDDTILCRCEEIDFAQARAGLIETPGHLGTLKRATRVGMGRCQGRYCGPVAARLVAEATGEPITDHSYFAPRVPIKPVSIAAILAAQEALDADD